MNSAFFDTPFTRFFFQSIDNTAVLAEESMATRGTTMGVIKVVMPLIREDNADEWRVVNSDQVKMVGGDSSEKSDSEGAEEEGDISVEYGDSAEGDG
jgi:hypothetical protein